jgi:isoamylase
MAQSAAAPHLKRQTWERVEGSPLPLVYNHTCEGDHRGPIYSFKGIDSSGYYMMSREPANPYANYSGTGNTLNFGHAHVRKMVMDSLRYWKQEMHIDGFRFDLANTGFSGRTENLVAA